MRFTDSTFLSNYTTYKTFMIQKFVINGVQYYMEAYEIYSETGYC